MIDMESRVGRRIIGRIETGRPLEEALLGVCRKYGVEACEVRVTGILRDPILLAYKEEDAEFTAAYRVPGLATLVSLNGDVSLLGSELLLNAKAMVAWDDRGFPRLAAGHLKSATVHSVEYVLDSFDDVALERGFDPITRLPLWTAITRRDASEGGNGEAGPRNGQSGAQSQRKFTPEPKKARTMTPPPGMPISPPQQQHGAQHPTQHPAQQSTQPRPVTRPSLPTLPPPPPVAPSPIATPDALRSSPRIVASMSDDLEEGPELRPVNERDIEVVRRPPRKGSWSDVVTRSRELDEEEEEEDDVEPMPGDVLNHPKFGRCIVLGSDEDERVLVRRPGGGKAALSRSHMKLYRTGTTDEGKAIYRLTVTRLV